MAGRVSEEQAGDVSESGGAARRDSSAGEEFVEGGEGVVGALGGPGSHRRSQ